MQSATTALPAAAGEEWALAPETPRRVQLARLARRNPIGVIALILVMAFVVLGVSQVIAQEVFGTAVAPYDPTEINASQQLQGPSWAHPFGTNQRGNDILSRVLAGARISFLIGLMSVTIGFLPGALLGIISGYYQRWLDYVIQRGGEAWSAFPVLFLYLAFITAFGQGLKTIAIVIIISSIFGGSRVLRAVALIMKQNDFVEASRALGASEVRIVFRHIVPNVMPIVIVGASSVFAVSVLAESALSFLGIGVAPGTPSWGIDLNEGLDNARFFPHLVLFPGIAISLVVLGFNLLGDTLRDILDPRLRGSLG
ncbi:MAG: ABC transporter permease [Dehalococcoidia bacterium]|nr:ABC transporter permease [Dehalococcoidia bacterium]